MIAIKIIVSHLKREEPNSKLTVSFFIFGRYIGNLTPYPHEWEILRTLIGSGAVNLPGNIQFELKEEEL